MKYKAVRGMEDILPPDIGIWQELERRARKELEFHGYVEIRTPIVEDTAVFTRSIGETTDIVKKEMYTFADRKERSLALRPEGTAPIVRAYIEHSLHKISPQMKLYYIGPMFRNERPQKGRSRQFHQIGVEVFGASASFDAIVIKQLNDLLAKCFRLENFKVRLNSLGCNKDKKTYACTLRDFLKKEKNRLCDDCRERVERNVMRVLDCKNETCVQVVHKAPSILDNLCRPCQDNFKELTTDLDRMGVRPDVAKNLVRGLDYYTGTVFEVTHPALGGQDAIGAGGRYDNLVKEMGGPEVKAIGYALGIERIILALKKELPSSKIQNVIYIATLGDLARIEGVQLTDRIKAEFLESVIVLSDVGESSLKSQMRNADRHNAKLVLILGEDELKAAKVKVIVRDMVKKEQVAVDRDNIVAEIRKRLASVG